MSEEQHATAVIAALNAFTAQPFDFDDIPATLPPYYTEVTVSRRYGETTRGESATVELWRITVRAVAKTVSNAREMRRRAAQIEGRTLTIGGLETTPVQFETSDPIAPDEAWYSGLSTYTYSI